MTGAKCKPAKQPKLRSSSNAQECAIESPRKALSAVMREKADRRQGMLALAKANVEKQAIGVFMDCSVHTVHRWIRRGAQTSDLSDLPRSGRPATYTEDIALKVVAFYCQTRPLPGCGRWTLTWAEAHLAAHPEQIGACPGRSTIHRILRNSSLKPHLSIYFL